MDIGTYGNMYGILEYKFALKQLCKKIIVPQYIIIHDCTINLLYFSANLVLHRTIERIHVGKKYGDIPRGIFVVRGENVVLLGEIVSKTILQS